MNEKIHYKENPFIAVKTGPKADHYMYSERKGIDSVAFIIQTTDDFYILTQERKPPMDARINENIPGIIYNSDDEAFIVTAFGGSNDRIPVEEYIDLKEVEKISLFKDIVKDEAIEEAGYVINTDDVRFLGKEFVSTQSNQLCYLFLVDARNSKVVERQPENEMEAQAENVVYTSDYIRNSIDWKSKSILFRMGV